MQVESRIEFKVRWFMMILSLLLSSRAQRGDLGPGAYHNCLARGGSFAQRAQIPRFARDDRKGARDDLRLLNRTKLDPPTVLEMRARFRDLASFRGVVNANEKKAAETIAAHD